MIQLRKKLAALHARTAAKLCKKAALLSLGLSVMSWSRAFHIPIPLPDGRVLRTLQTTTGGVGQSTGTTTGGIAEQPGTGQRSAPNTNTQTTGPSITGLPLSNPTEIQAQRNRGAGTAPNGQPIGSSGSGLGSSKQPINSGRRLLIPLGH